MAVGENTDKFNATSVVVETLSPTGVTTTAEGTPSAKDDRIKFLRDISNNDAVNIQIVYDEKMLQGTRVETFNMWKANYEADEADFSDYDSFKTQSKVIINGTKFDYTVGAPKQTTNENIGITLSKWVTLGVAKTKILEIPVQYWNEEAEHIDFSTIDINSI